MKIKDEKAFLADLDAKGIPYVLGGPVMPVSVGIAEAMPPKLPVTRKRGKKTIPLLPYTVVDSGAMLSISMPIATKNIANLRAWQERSNITRQARGIVGKCLGQSLRRLADYAEHYHSGRPIYLTFTRVGGRKVDNLAGLGPCLKPVEDAVALILGADDGDPRWRATAGQRPGGEVGVIVTLSKEP